LAGGVVAHGSTVWQKIKRPEKRVDGKANNRISDAGGIKTFDNANRRRTRQTSESGNRERKKKHLPTKSGLKQQASEFHWRGRKGGIFGGEPGSKTKQLLTPKKTLITDRKRGRRS